jgi:D-alanyl-D-alanine carboxypeptidase/D-alanyl-D-alanine-endopeptidase (penicillin-binding protein 4)
LTYASQQPWGAYFADSLPLAGVDGSLADRFKLGAAQQRVEGKTGALGHVNALSGYATTLKGDRVVFAIVANNHNLPSKRALDVIDMLVDAILAEK